MSLNMCFMSCMSTIKVGLRTQILLNMSLDEANCNCTKTFCLKKMIILNVLNAIRKCVLQDDINYFYLLRINSNVIKTMSRKLF